MRVDGGTGGDWTPKLIYSSHQEIPPPRAGSQALCDNHGL